MTLHSREGYWGRPGQGTFLADLNYMDSRHPDEMAILLRQDEFFVRVDVIAGDKVLTTREWLVSVREHSLIFERAFSEVASFDAIETNTFLLPLLGR